MRATTARVGLLRKVSDALRALLEQQCRQQPHQHLEASIWADERWCRILLEDVAQERARLSPPPAAASSEVHPHHHFSKDSLIWGEGPHPQNLVIYYATLKGVQSEISTHQQHQTDDDEAEEPSYFNLLPDEEDMNISPMPQKPYYLDVSNLLS